MDIIETAIPDVKRLVPRRFADQRGFFTETWNAARLSAAGLDLAFCQDNHSYSAAPGTVRGLHYQAPPMAQAKLIRVARSPAPLRAVLIDLGASTDLDIASLDMLRDLVIELREAGIETLFAQVRGITRDRLRKTGLMQEIGDRRVFYSVEAAVQDVVHRYAQAPQPDLRAQPDETELNSVPNSVPVDPVGPAET